jgi:hypothetical protein
LGSLLFTSDDFGKYSAEQKAELEEALSWQGSQISSVVEWTEDVWQIALVQGASSWSAFSNLTSQDKKLSLPNGAWVDLRPFETLILKS